MIRFACVYCGAKVTAQDRQACRQATCPACGHTLRVPAKHVAQSPPAGEAEPAPSPPTANLPQGHADAPAPPDPWAGKSNKQIAKALLKKPLTPEQKERLATRRAVTVLMPRYDNLTLFALSTAFLLLALSGSISIQIPAPLAADSSIAETFAALALKMLEQFAGLFVLAVFGMFLSLFGVFARGPTPRPVKFLMLSFAVFATSGTGVYAGTVILGKVQSWPMMVFPLWNIVNGISLLVLLRTGLIDPDCIVDRPPKPIEVVVTLIAVVVLLAICRYGLHLHWAIAYSICACYTISLNHALQDLFGNHAEPLTSLEEAPGSPDGRSRANG